MFVEFIARGFLVKAIALVRIPATSRLVEWLVISCASPVCANVSQIRKNLRFQLHVEIRRSNLELSTERPFPKLKRNGAGRESANVRAVERGFGNGR